MRFVKQLLVVAVIGAVVKLSWPDVSRYLKIRKM
jgi:hypothetical protein